MLFKIIGKNITVTEAIEDYAKAKVSKIEKYFDANRNESSSCRVLVRTYKFGAKCEITISTKDTTFRAEVYNDDLYAAIDLAIDKLAGQLRKLKTKIERRRKERGLGEAIRVEQIEAEENLEVDNNEPKVRVKYVKFDKMPVEEAIFRMEAVDHKFFIFRDMDEAISIIYKKDNGEYGLIVED